MIFKKDRYQNEKLLLKIICIAWFIAKIISYKTWISDRLFPVISVFDLLSDIPNTIHFILYILSLTGLVFVFIFPKNKYIITSFLVIEITACSLDQMRWQPWEYQYLLTFLFFILSKDNKQFIQLTSLLIIATYFYGGLNKLNGGFLTFTWENMILNRMFSISKETIHANLGIHYLGTLLAITEMFFGLALLFLKNKKAIVILIVFMHIFILLLIGPISNYNHIVWPWNIAMILLLFVLFYNKEKLELTKCFLRSKVNIIFLTMLFIMPISNKHGFWPNHFSFNLYTGNLNKLSLCIKNFKNYPELEQYKKKKNSTICNDYKEIDVFKWTMNDLYTPINSDRFTSIQLKKAWIKKYPNSDIHMFLSSYPYKKENIVELK